MRKIGIIGAGAAGLTAAYFASQNKENRIVLFEKNSRPAAKLLITGKGRCNLTNAAAPREMLDFIPRGARFLQSSLFSFSSEDAVRFFEERGVKTKVERGGRVFPVSDRALDVAHTLIKAATEKENVFLCKKEVLSVQKKEDRFLIETRSGREEFDRVILATGGKSYPKTGSTGDGYRFAKEFGHTVTAPRPSLIPLVTAEKDAAEMMGLSLKNIAVTVKNEAGKTVYEDFGEMLFTHFGVSGPVILSASAYLDFDGGKSYTLLVDLKPALSKEMLEKRLLREFEENINRDFLHTVSSLFPQKMILPILKRCEIEPRKKTNLVTREERKRLLETTKALPFTLLSARPIEEAIITRGGVELKEIVPKTMESRLVPGLFFAGELLDADALTGGFNLQIAWSTGRAAGIAAAAE